MLPAQRSVASAAKALGIELETFEVRVPADFDRVLGAAAAKRHKVALIIDDPITISNAKVMADAALKHRIATAGFVEYAEAGGLLGYGVNLNGDVAPRRVLRRPHRQRRESRRDPGRALDHLRFRRQPPHRESDRGQHPGRRAAACRPGDRLRSNWGS